MARIAGGLALAVSIVIAVSLPLRDVDFNVANLWTLLLGTAGGLVASRARSRGEREPWPPLLMWGDAGYPAGA